MSAGSFGVSGPALARLTVEGTVVEVRRLPLWEVEGHLLDGGDAAELVAAAVTAVDGVPVVPREAARLWAGWTVGDRDTVTAAVVDLARGSSRVDRVLARIRSDRGFAAVMDHIAPLGIPLTRFLGGPDAWDGLSRDAALAWSADQAARCGDCGQRRIDWMRPGPDGTLVEIVPPPFRVIDQVCPACAAGERASKARRADGEPEPGMKLAYQAVDQPPA